MLIGCLGVGFSLLFWDGDLVWSLSGYSLDGVGVGFVMCLHSHSLFLKPALTELKGTCSIVVAVLLPCFWLLVFTFACKSVGLLNCCMLQGIVGKLFIKFNIMWCRYRKFSSLGNYPILEVSFPAVCVMSPAFVFAETPAVGSCGCRN